VNHVEAAVRSPDTFFIGGEWVAPATDELIEVISPVTEEVFATAPAGARPDIDHAVARARAAFDHGPWPRMSPKERADIMAALADRLAARSEEIAQLITRQNGCPISFSRPGQALGPVLILRYYADLVRDFAFEQERPSLYGPGRNVVRREPLGVVGAIVPWNAPLLVSLLKLAPALAAGCTAVLKPAPETPLDSYILAECVRDAGVPAGVVNIVAAGREVSEYLVTHPDVDKIAFTGSSATGRRIAALCGERLRPVTLELGGKSAAIVCDDADLDAVLPGLVSASTTVSGQACVSQTRILASRKRYQEVSDGLTECYRALRVGDPLDPETAIGPMVAQRQRARVEDYIASGRAEGARVTVGGGRPAHLSSGWYVEPTIFVDVDNRMRIAQEEIFGPVTSIIAYDDVAEAVALANDSAYGLSGTVWSADPEYALGIARQVRTGTLTVNGFMVEFNCPFGGYKDSGLGREGGPEGLDAYLEHKTIALPENVSAVFS
jgi:betaine-aldehyde dehydrogenase